MKTLSLRAVVLLALATPGLAAELRVGPGQPFATISAAINAAVNGDSIRVYPGTYFERVHYGGKDLDIFSDSNDPANTTIDAQFTGTAVWIASQSAGSLTGFTVKNGSATTAGGGLLVSFRSPLVRNCIFQENRAPAGAGAFIQGGSPRFEGCRFTLNQVITSAPIPPDGGGMYVDQSLAEFIDCRIDSNFAPGLGGGIYVRLNSGGGPDGARYENCLIQFNRASSGGGVAATTDTSALFERCEILNNVADLAPLAGNVNAGGGVYSFEACPQLSSCLIAENRTGTPNNIVRVGNGGGMYQEGFGFPGGSLGESVVEFCTFANNKAGDAPLNTGSGGGLCTKESITFVRNSILWANTARTNGQQIAVLNSSGIGGTFVTTTYCDLQGGSAAVFNQLPAAQNYVFNNLQNVNPAFVGGSDYHLTPASPVIGTGHPTVLPDIGVLDLDGDPRLLGLRTDLGMDEFDDCTVITFYGPLTPNTAGPGAQITLVGSTSVSANNATLRATGGPPGHTGIFFYGPEQRIVPLGFGNHLVGGFVQRIQTPVVFDASGVANLPVDWTQHPFTGINTIVPGSSWNFQFWFRDGGSTNLTNAMHITFCP